MDLDNNAHSVFLLYYHLIMVVKYRRKVIDDVISNRCELRNQHSCFPLVCGRNSANFGKLITIQ